MLDQAVVSMLSLLIVLSIFIVQLLQGNFLFFRLNPIFITIFFLWDQVIFTVMQLSSWISIIIRFFTKFVLPIFDYLPS